MIKFYAYIHLQGLGPIPRDYEFDEVYMSIEDAANTTVADLIEMALANDQDDDYEEDEDD